MWIWCEFWRAFFGHEIWWYEFSPLFLVVRVRKFVSPSGMNFWSEKPYHFHGFFHTHKFLFIRPENTRRAHFFTQTIGISRAHRERGHAPRKMARKMERLRLTQQRQHALIPLAESNVSFGLLSNALSIRATYLENTQPKSRRLRVAPIVHFRGPSRKQHAQLDPLGNDTRNQTIAVSWTHSKWHCPRAPTS